MPDETTRVRVRVTAWSAGRWRLVREEERRLVVHPALRTIAGALRVAREIGTRDGYAMDRSPGESGKSRSGKVWESHDGMGADGQPVRIWFEQV